MNSELTRFRGHLTFWGIGVYDAENATTISGLEWPDIRTGRGCDVLTDSG